MAASAHCRARYAARNGNGCARYCSHLHHCGSIFSSAANRSEEHTSELQSLMRRSYAVFCLKKKKDKPKHYTHHHLLDLDNSHNTVCHSITQTQPHTNITNTTL